MTLVFISLAAAVAVIIIGHLLCCNSVAEGGLGFFMLIIVPGGIGLVFSFIALLVGLWSVTSAMYVAIAALACCVAVPVAVLGPYAIPLFLRWAWCLLFHRGQGKSTGCGVQGGPRGGTHMVTVEGFRCERCGREWSVIGD